MIIGNLKFEAYFEVLYHFLHCTLFCIQGLEGHHMLLSDEILSFMEIWDYKFQRTENYIFFTNTSQHVEFFHSLIFFLFPEANLCEVRIRVFPACRTLVNVSHSNRLAMGSIPVVGSSRNIMGGSPISAIAVLSFLLLPPLAN